MPAESSVAAPIRTFFGAESRSIFGVVQLPANGRARAGVVICPPLAKEQGDTTRGLKLLAAELAARGFATLRFDYRHTGESWGDQTDRDAAHSMVESIDEAIEFLRTAGANHIAAVGLRAGALLATQTQSLANGIDAFVLWDPVLRGRSYIRGSRSLYQLAVGDNSDVDPLVHIVGASWHRDTANAMSKMQVLPNEIIESMGADAVLCMPRDTDLDTAPIAAMSSAGVEVLSAGDMAPFVQPDGFYVEIPVATIGRIADWLNDQFGRRTSDITLHARPEAVMAVRDGVEIRTRLAETPSGIALWETDAVTAHRAVVTHSTACDIRTGPGRVWYEAALTAAKFGVRTIRFDRHGVGETDPVRLPDDFAPLHSQRARDDGLEVADYVAQFGRIASQQVHAGVCSGAWTAAYTALNAPQPVSLVMINNLMWRAKNPLVVDQTHLEEATLPTPAVDSPISVPHQSSPRRMPWKSRLKPVVRGLAPYWAWTLMGRAKIMMVPQLLIQDLAKQAIATRLVFGPDDYAHFITQRGTDAVDDARGRGAEVTLRVVPRGDHPAFHWVMRETAVGSVLDALEINTGVESPQQLG